MRRMLTSFSNRRLSQVLDLLLVATQHAADVREVHGQHSTTVGGERQPTVKAAHRIANRRDD